MEYVFDESLRTGDDHIDQQHRELLAWGHAIAHPDASRRGLTFIKGLGFLAEYVRVHFADEERAMAKHRFPRRLQHASLHREFRRKLAALYERAKAGEAPAALLPVLERHMTGWFVRHIRGTDRRFARWLREQGARAEAGHESHVSGIMARMGVDTSLLDSVTFKTSSQLADRPPPTYGGTHRARAGAPTRSGRVVLSPADLAALDGGH